MSFLYSWNKISHLPSEGATVLSHVAGSRRASKEAVLLKLLMPHPTLN